MKIFAYSVREDEVKYMEQFRAAGVDLEYTYEYPSMDNLDLLKGKDAVSIITNIITPEMYEAWHNLGIKYIATRSIGFEHLNTECMMKYGMRAVHASYSPVAVANYTIMLMLMACRKINLILEKARLQDFELYGKIGREISESTVGIIGTGRIGECLIKHLSGFGCRILAYDICEKDSVRQYAEYVDLDTLYKESDIISLHVPGLERNYHMIDASAFAKMKDDVIIINAARGMLIDSWALIDVLESGKVGFAALDTFEEEFGMYYKNLEYQNIPNRVRTVLNGFNNVILSPHMAFYTEKSTSDMVGTTVNGLLAFEKGGINPAEITY